MSGSRNRPAYGTGVLLVIALGLASRKFPIFPALLGKYPGDALWALMVFLALGMIFARWKTVHLAALALAISFAVEFSQLYRAEWLVEIRGTTAGHLVLGSRYGSLDLLAYAIGVAIGAAVEVCGLIARRDR